MPLEKNRKLNPESEEKIDKFLDKFAEAVRKKPLLFCPYCAKVYVNVNNFAMHLRDKHNCSETEIENIVQRFMKKHPELQRKKLKKGKTFWFEKTKKLDDYFSEG